MLTIDILISVKDSHIVRIKDSLPEEMPGVHYIISYQYTDEKFLRLIPEQLEKYPDVLIIKTNRTGVSESRNTALSYAQSDLIYFIDDDMHLIPGAIENIRETFEQNPKVDIALFQAQNYSGKILREYPKDEKKIETFIDCFKILTSEMVCRRNKVQGILKFDTRFGLGSGCFICYEQQIWLEDAKRAKLKIKYFPIPIIQTSALYLPLQIFVNNNVQKAMGGLLSYVYGHIASVKAFQFAFLSSQKEKCQLLSFNNALIKGILRLRHTHKPT